MLSELRIKNFTIIDSLSINFETGLNVLTGETGAGKSIIVDAIGLILGGKSSPDMIKTGKNDAHIEALFHHAKHPLLEELAIESADGITIRRNIASKGRAFINDASVSLQTLSNIGRSLVDIHGQHEHQGLLKKESHLLFIDVFGGLLENSASVQALYNEVMSLRNKVAGLKDRIRERGQKIEFLRFQLNEIDAAGLKQGEKEAIEGERAILLNLNKLKEASETAYNLLYESEVSCLDQLSTVVSRVRDMARIDLDAQELLNVLESAVPLLEDASVLLRKTRDKYDIDPQRLVELDERFELIKRLQKKYGEGIEEILKYREHAQKELKDLEHIEEEQETFETELNVKEDALMAMAEELSKKRAVTVGKMERAVVKELHELGFQNAVFKVEIKKKEGITASGLDDAEFLFSANPGEPPKPLIKVASGGELSRIMLALKCIEIGQESGVKSRKPDAPPNPPLGRGVNSELRTLIFDEVDAGIGGVTAQHVGKRLKAIAGSYQVFCITHLPQIAALADHHIKVEKNLHENSVEVTVRPLHGAERQEEIARMLSGSVTDVSLKHAQEMLGLTKTVAAK